MIRAPIVLPRELIEPLGVAVRITTVGTGRAGVLRRMTDSEQLIPLVLGLSMFGRAHDRKGGNSRGGDPFAIMRDVMVEEISLYDVRCTLYDRVRRSVVAWYDAALSKKRLNGTDYQRCDHDHMARHHRYV